MHTTLCPNCQALRSVTIVVDTMRGEASWNGGAIALAKREVIVLGALVERPRSMGDLAILLWGDDANGGPENAEACIRNYVSRVRIALRDAGFPGTIKCRYGTSYSLVVPPPRGGVVDQRTLARAVQ